ncbi:MAG: dephospho-CoA kinase [Syntrophales bacterium]|nr:dephospho-CoA kinase [Syntrophales bacterium]
MLNVGLTGGIASGKSTVAKMLVEKGARHIDLDALAHFVQEPDRPAWRSIVDSFGKTVLNDDATINRDALGAIVFQDRTKLKLLNDIVHPAVLDEWRRQLEDIGGREPGAIIISDVPLLIEENLQPLVDMVVLVFITPEEQIRRLVARNGFSEEEAVRRLASQMPIRDKLPYADLVINNEGTLDETRDLLDHVWRKLLGQENLVKK